MEVDVDSNWLRKWNSFKGRDQKGKGVEIEWNFKWRFSAKGVTRRIKKGKEYNKVKISQKY